MRRLAFAAVPLSALALLAAGCGGSKSDTSSADKWASSVCTAFATWKTSLTNAVDSVKGGVPTKASIQSAAGDAKTATNKLVTDLKGLGKPNTDAGAKAQSELNNLADELQKDMTTIENALNSSSPLTALSTAATSLQSMLDQVRSTYTQLQQVDPKGELKKAFQNASSCKSLTG
jgi:hypothetical protein